LVLKLRLLANITLMTPPTMTMPSTTEIMSSTSVKPRFLEMLITAPT
jgi:hypothetical protein